MGKVSYFSCKEDFYYLQMNRFKVLAKNSDLSPTFQNLKAFFKWYAIESKGRLSEHATIDTLVWKVGRFTWMYNTTYEGEKIPDSTRGDIRNVSPRLIWSATSIDN